MQDVFDYNETFYIGEVEVAIKAQTKSIVISDDEEDPAKVRKYNPRIKYITFCIKNQAMVILFGKFDKKRLERIYGIDSADLNGHKVSDYAVIKCIEVEPNKLDHWLDKINDIADTLYQQHIDAKQPGETHDVQV